MKWTGSMDSAAAYALITTSDVPPRLLLAWVFPNSLPRLPSPASRTHGRSSQSVRSILVLQRLTSRRRTASTRASSSRRSSGYTARSTAAVNFHCETGIQVLQTATIDIKIIQGGYINQFFHESVVLIPVFTACCILFFLQCGADVIISWAIFLVNTHIINSYYNIYSPARIL